MITIASRVPALDKQKRLLNCLAGGAVCRQLELAFCAQPPQARGGHSRRWVPLLAVPHVTNSRVWVWGVEGWHGEGGRVGLRAAAAADDMEELME